MQFEGWSLLYVYGPLMTLGFLGYSSLVCSSIFFASPELLPPIPLALLVLTMLPLAGGIFLVLFAWVGCRSGSLRSGAFPFTMNCPMAAIYQVLGETEMVDLHFETPGMRISDQEIGFVRLVTGGLLPIPWCHSTELEGTAAICASSPATTSHNSIANRIIWRSNPAANPRLGNGIISFLGLAFLVSLTLHTQRGSMNQNTVSVGAIGVVILLAVGVWSLVGKTMTKRGIRVSAFPWQRLDISGGAVLLQPSSWDTVTTTQPAILECSGQERVVAIDPVSLAGLVVDGLVERSSRVIQ